MKELQFSWKGKEYTVKVQAASRKHIVLPNRTVIKPKWFRDPVGFVTAEEVPHNLNHATLGEIAEHVGSACLAHEAY